MPNNNLGRPRLGGRIAWILQKVCEAADRESVPCFLVGGTVRDAILQRAVLDLDLLVDTANAAQLSAAQFAELLSSSLHASRPVCFDRYGTYHFVVAKTPVPADEGPVSQSQGHGESPIEVEVVGASLKVTGDFEVQDPEDIYRRDFTVNTLLLGLNGGNFLRLYDPTGQGMKDLRLQVLRCPRKPSETLAADPIRMLRAVRLAWTLGFTLDDALRDCIGQSAALINEAAIERIRKELELILMSDHAAAAVRMLQELNLLAEILPEVSALSGVTQDKRFHSQDVFEHALSVLANVSQHHEKVGAYCDTPSTIVLRLAALLHDVGKRDTKAFKEERVVFYGHEHLGESIVNSRLSALRFPNRLIKDVSALVRNHMINYSDEWTDAAIRRLIKRLGPLLPKQLDLYEADIRALYDSDRLLDEARELRQRIESIDRKEKVAELRSPLDGHEICRLLGIKPGPLVGQYKAKLLEAVLSGHIPNDKDAARDYLLKLAASG